MTTAGQPDVMTVEEVATRLRLSKMTVYRLVHAGQLDGFRAGRTIRVHRASVDKIMESMCPNES